MDLALYKAAQPFSQKHLLTLQDWSEDEILQCLSLAVKLKTIQKADRSRPVWQERRLQ